MALFARMANRVVGKELKFDNLTNIKTNEEVDDEGCENEVQYVHDRAEVPLFRKQSNHESSIPHKDVNVKSHRHGHVSSSAKTSPELRDDVNKVDENIKPIHVSLNKGVSVNNTALQQRNAASTPRFHNQQAPVKDARFATSRTESFTTATTFSEKSSYSEHPIESEDLSEDASIQSDDDQASTDVDYIEMVFSKVRHNHIDFVINVLNKGFQPNTRDANGNTILHITAQNNLKKLASAVLKSRPQCDINAKNKKALTPLDYCEKYGFARMSEWLVSKGAKSGSYSTSKPAASQFR